MPTEFESYYLRARKKEGFFYSDEQVKKLPETTIDDPHYEKWMMRYKSTNRFLQYIKSRRKSGDVLLDLGCGNGWFTAKLAHGFAGEVLGWDVNQEELDQAQRVFPSHNLSFQYKGIFKETTSQRFNFIIINSAFQYFPDPSRLIHHLWGMLKVGGEIHLLDSPFYEENKVEHARNRTIAYYKNIGTPEMVNFYHHHTLKSLGEVPYEIMYNPKKWYRKLARKLGVKDSPFLWLKIKK